MYSRLLYTTSMLRNREIENFIKSLVFECPSIKSILLIGEQANESFDEDSDWGLLVFGSREILSALISNTRLHKENKNGDKQKWGQIYLLLIPRVLTPQSRNSLVD